MKFRYIHNQGSYISKCYHVTTKADRAFLPYRKTFRKRLTIPCIDFSPKFPEEYPLLYERLCDRSDDEVHWVCLGPNGTFFAKWEHNEYYHLPPSIASKIEAVKDDGITAVALGIDKTYVIVHGGKVKWNLKGHYGRLATQLRNARSSPEVCSPGSSKSSKTRLSLISVVWLQ